HLFRTLYSRPLQMINTLMRAAVVSLATFSFASSAFSADPPVLKEERFDVRENAEVIATLTASCEGCDWGRAGYEAAALRLSIDGRYAQHLFLTRGSAKAEYSVLLGSFQKGTHTLSVSLDPVASSPKTQAASVSKLHFKNVTATQPDYAAVSLAPIIFARPNTVGHFTDTPLFMWYETDKTDRGSRIRYSVIFSNEDGGTPADRLLATWGRLTDIEYVYGIEFDQNGKVLEETFQGKDHEIVNFSGKREGRHPLLYVVTDNNMVRDSGTTSQRYAPAPVGFDLTNVSREEVMDKNPWMYAVTAKEARREGRVNPNATPGSKTIVDPTRYAVAEICTAADDTTFATFTFSIGVSQDHVVRYYDSTGGVPEYRISRSPDNFPNSCFRGAVALPKGTRSSDVASVRVSAHARMARKGEPAPPKDAGPARLRRINKVFLMSSADLPEASVFSWTGETLLPLDGAPATLEVTSTSKK
ncbi:MAG: hypothetical protein ABI672_16695, partial [Vicinamibacteria bacterium]